MDQKAAADLAAVRAARSAALAADLRSLQDMVNRRGPAWLEKWTAMFSGVPTGQATFDLDRALRDGDTAKAEYLAGDRAFVLDPRN